MIFPFMFVAILAVIVVVVITLGYITNMHEESRKEFQDDIKQLLVIQDNNTYNTKIKELKSKHYGFFNDIIKQTSNGTILSIHDIDNMIDYIIQESIKNEKYKQFLSEGNITVITSENRTYGTIYDPTYNATSNNITSTNNTTQ